MFWYFSPTNFIFRLSDFYISGASVAKLLCWWSLLMSDTFRQSWRVKFWISVLLSLSYWFYPYLKLAPPVPLNYLAENFTSPDMLDDHGLHYYNKYKCKHTNHKCKYKYNVNGLHLELHKWLHKCNLHIYYININASTHQHTKLKYFDISSYSTSLIVFKGYIFFFKCWYVLNVCKTW